MCENANVKEIVKGSVSEKGKRRGKRKKKRKRKSGQLIENTKCTEKKKKSGSSVEKGGWRRMHSGQRVRSGEKDVN
jgi:hypothetical protein